MSKEYTTQEGKVFTHLNPSEKADKYSRELRDKKALTNKFEVKRDDKDNPIVLTPAQRAYRAGYLDARQDSAYAWCKKNGVQSRAKKRTRG